jgi:hypothetical protein
MLIPCAEVASLMEASSDPFSTAYIFVWLRKLKTILVICKKNSLFLLLKWDKFSPGHIKARTYILRQCTYYYGDQIEGKIRVHGALKWEMSPEGKQQLHRPWRRHGDNIKTDLK